jgi:hypothetical protein
MLPESVVGYERANSLLCHCVMSVLWWMYVEAVSVDQVLNSVIGNQRNNPNGHLTSLYR